MLAEKDAGMSEPPKAVSFQRPANSEKHKISAVGEQDSWGAFFLLLLLHP
jgi:hypothetical protein